MTKAPRQKKPTPPTPGTSLPGKKTHAETISDKRSNDMIDYVWDNHEKLTVKDLKHFIDKGADINWQNAQGDTILIVLVYIQHTEGVRYILSLHPDLSLKNWSGDDVFDDARKNNCHDMLNILNQYRQDRIRELYRQQAKRIGKLPAHKVPTIDRIGFKKKQKNHNNGQKR